jgi:hypothetical protein
MLYKIRTIHIEVYQMVHELTLKTVFLFYSYITFTICSDVFLGDLKPSNTKYVCSAASYNFISPGENCCTNSDENKMSDKKSNMICKKLYLMQKQHTQSTFSYDVNPIIRFSEFKYNKVEEQLEVPGIFSEIWQNTIKSSCKIHSSGNGDFVRLHLIIGIAFSDPLNEKKKKKANENSQSKKDTSKFIGIKWGKDWLDVTDNYKENEKKEQDCIELPTKKLFFRMFHKPKLVNDIIPFLTRTYDIPLAKFSGDTNDKSYIFPLFKAFSNGKNLKYFSLIEVLKKRENSQGINFDKSFLQGCALVSCEKVSAKSEKNFSDLQSRISENFIKIKNYSEKLSNTKDARQIKKRDLFLSHIVHTLETRLNKKIKRLEKNNNFVEPTLGEVSEVCKEATMPLLDHFKKKYQDEEIHNVISYIDGIKTLLAAETASDEQSKYLETMLKDVVIIREHPFSD